MNSDIQVAHKLIIKDLEIENQGIAISSLEKLKKWLAGELNALIDRDFQKLINLLYRIDVDEQKTKIAFTDSDPSTRLAELIIERELQKVETRKRNK